MYLLTNLGFKSYPNLRLIFLTSTYFVTTLIIYQRHQFYMLHKSIVCYRHFDTMIVLLLHKCSVMKTRYNTILETRPQTTLPHVR